MRQWHPLFVQLLRPWVERYYEVRTTVAVGDLPREADVVLLRRTAAGRAPFRGLWKNLTTWNVLEFKGPTVSARVRDLDLLVELALGIDRRLNQERTRHGQRPLEPTEVSLWYVAKRLGQRFLRAARDRLERLEAAGPGLWRSRMLRRPVFLVSRNALAMEADSAPLHMMERESPEVQSALGRLLADREDLWNIYGPWLRVLHPAVWREVGGMARRTGREWQIDFQPLIEAVGIKGLIDEMGLKRILDEVGYERVVAELGVDDILAHLTPAQRAELKRKLR